MANKDCINIESVFEGVLEQYYGTDFLDEFKAMSKEKKMAVADDVYDNTRKEVRRTTMTAAAQDIWENYFKKGGEVFRRKKGKLPKNYRAKMYVDISSGNGIRQAGLVSLERRAEGILYDFHRKVIKGLEKYRSRKLGLQHSYKAQRNILEEIFEAGSTGDKDAADFAKVLTGALEDDRKLFNNAGGDIDDLADYGLPQHHDPVRINRVEQEEWVEFVRDKVDQRRLFFHADPNTVISQETVTKLLNRVYENLSSDGTLHRKMAVNPHVRRMIGNYHQEHRLLHFNTAKDWMDYADRFGGKDYVQTVMSQADMMSKEIAAMQMLGPNPDAMMEYLRMEFVQKGATVDHKSAGWLGAETYKQVMGRVGMGSTKLADTMNLVRNISIGLKIGKAAISAISDTAFLGITSRFNGLPVMKTYGALIKGMVANKGQRTLAAHLQLGAEHAIHNAKSAYRISGVAGVGGAKEFSNFIVKASGLNFWTNVSKNSFGLSMLHHLGSLTERKYANLNPRLRKMFKRYGISSSDWDRMRDAPVFKHGNGAVYMDPSNLGDRELTLKLVGAILEERHMAVPEPDAKTLALMRGGADAGTPGGELARTVGTFKSFSVSVATSHWMRMLNETGWSRAGYLVSLLAGTTVLGGMALQGKKLVDGKTPVDMTMSKFWAAAFLQGGGTGILGDFLFQDHGRRSAAAEFLLGPVGADASVLLGLLFGSQSDFNQARDDIWEIAGGRVARSVDKILPNLWYTNLLLKRALGDYVQRSLNPHWSRDQRAARGRMRRDDGNRYWLRPGEFTPRF